MASKGVTREQVDGMLGDVTVRAAQVGLPFAYDHLVHTNTVRALQLLHYAKKHGRQLDMNERLFEAHFTEGKNVGQIDVLAALAAEVGLDKADVTRSLETDEHLAHVRVDVDEARRLGIRAVPFYDRSRRTLRSGARFGWVATPRPASLEGPLPSPLGASLRFIFK